METIRTKLLEYAGKKAVEERINLIKIQDAALSAYTSEPLNIAVTGAPGSGKTHLILKAVEPFPEEDKQILRSVTPTAFYRERGQKAVWDAESEAYVTTIRNEITGQMVGVDEYISYLSEKAYPSQKDKSGMAVAHYKELLRKLQANIWTLVVLKHKIIVFLDSQAEKILQGMAPILSHDTYYTKLRVVDPTSTGKQQTRGIVIEGWPAIIYATSSPKGIFSSADINSRFEVVEPVTTTTKVSKSKQLIARDMFGWTAVDKDLPVLREELQNVIHPLKINGLKTTLALTEQEIAGWIPSNDPEIMRRLKHILSHIRTEAYFNVEDRMQLSIQLEDGKIENYLVVRLEDVKTALENLLKDGALGAAISGLPLSSYRFYSWLLSQATQGYIRGTAITRDAAPENVKQFETWKSRQLSNLRAKGWIQEVEVEDGENLRKNEKVWKLCIDISTIGYNITCTVPDQVPESTFEAWFLGLFTLAPKMIIIGKNGSEYVYISDSNSVPTTGYNIVSKDQVKELLKSEYNLDHVNNNVNNHVNNNVNNHVNPAPYVSSTDVNNKNSNNILENSASPSLALKDVVLPGPEGGGELSPAPPGSLPPGSEAAASFDAELKGKTAYEVILYLIDKAGGMVIPEPEGAYFHELYPSFTADHYQQSFQALHVQSEIYSIGHNKWRTQRRDA